jgi:hypothetical protein
VSRQDSNNPLPIRLALLALPILVLVVYLQFSKSPVQDEVPSVAAENSEAIPKPPTTSVSPAVKPSVVQPAPEIPTNSPTVLDPESARVAVHKVENGVYDRATAIFGQEQIDIEWAGVYEQSLRDMFSAHHGLQRVSVNSISCHTTMCRIEVFTPRDTDADFFTAMFYDALDNYREGALKAEAAIARRMEQGMTSVYIARKDHMLGFY